MATTRILQAPPRIELLRPGEAARALGGVSVNTLHRWERDGMPTAIRTPAGHRRYPYQQVEQTARHLGIPWAVDR